MLFALVVPFVMNPVFADSFFVAPNESLMCTYDALDADENSTVVFSARWCQECTDLAVNTASCNLTVDETTGTCTYTAECKTGYENMTEVNTANVHCVVHSYDINYYNLYNGTNNSSNPSSYTVESPDIELLPATRNGYDFVGWYSNDNASQTQNSGFLVTRIDSGSIGDKDLYAGWNIIPYTISYELNGGNAVNPTSYNVETATFTINNPTKIGYDFDGWCVNDANCTNRVQTYTVQNGSVGNLEFTAFWTEQSYSITYHLDGGSATNQTSYNVETPTFTLNNPTKSNFEFAGWCENSANCSNPTLTYTITQGSTGDRDLYAVWRATDYTIIYHLDGGSATNQTSYNVETPTFTLVNPTKANYEFAGWCENSANCSNPTLTYTITQGSTGNKDLYAVWAPVGYTITYNLDGGSATNPTSYNVETPTFTLNNPTKRGYTFIGWCENNLYCSDVHQTHTIEQGSYGNKVFYAKWEANRYVITYSCGENGITNTSGVVYDSTFTMVAPFCNMVGQTQTGWDCNAVSDTDVSSVVNTFISGVYTIESDAICNAKWQEKVYAINYKDINDNNSTIDLPGLEPSQYTYAQLRDNNGIAITAEPNEKTGYSFIGWCTDRSRTTCYEQPYIEYIPNVEPAATTTYYANWELTTYEIEYDLNGGTNDERNPSTYNMKTETIVLYNPSKTGYRFLGWFDNPEFEGDQITKIAKGSTGNKQLYAKWYVEPYTITYNLNNGSFTADTYVPRTYNAEIESDIVLPEPIRTGFEFAGWYNNSNLTGEEYTVITKGSTGNLTFWANWGNKEYTIRYLCDSNNIVTDTVSYAGAYTVRQNVCGNNTGYEFDSWQCHSRADNTEFNLTSTNYWANDFDVDCEPVWNANKYTVVFYSNTGTGSKPNVICEYGTNCDVTNNNEITKLGYDFVGWSLDAYDEENVFVPNEDNRILVKNLLTEPGVVKLYAIWKLGSYHCDDGYYLPANSTTCNKCKSGFYCQEGTWNFNPDENQGDNSCAVLLGVFSAGSNEPRSRENDCFAYCPTKPGYITNQSYTPEETISVCRYPATIEYVDIENIEECPDSSKAYTLPTDTSVTLCNVPQSRPGYTFKGFVDNKGTEYIYTGSNIVVNTNGLVPNNNVVTMTGVWETNTRTITYNCNNSADKHVTKDVSYGENEALLDSSECPNPGYTFQGWRCAGNVSNTPQVLVDYIVVPDEDVVCDAVWNVHNYNVRFNANTGTGEKATISCVYNENCDITNHDEIVKNGYSFVGWSTDANNNSVMYYPSANNDIIVKNLTDEDNATVDLYAVWNLQDYNIRYELGGARLPKANPSRYNITTPTFTLNNPVLQGYTFKGWCEGSANCAEPVVEYVFNPVQNTGNKVFYAVFDTVTYHITYKYFTENGTEGVLDTLYPREYTVQDNIVYPTDVTYPYDENTTYQYAFNGWSTSADLSNVVYGFAPGMTGDITLYARWNIATPQGSVLYNCSKKRQITRTNYVGFAVVPATLEECGISETSYRTFEGWNCDGTVYSATEGVVVAENQIVCNPQWNYEEYSITYKYITEDGTESVIPDSLLPNTYTAEDTVVYPTDVAYPYNDNTIHQYAFNGWSTSADLSNVVYGFAPGMTGDITLYARWNIATPQGNVVYDCGNRRQITRTNYVGFTVSPATATECRIDTETLIGWICDEQEYALDENVTVKDGTITCNVKLKEPEPEVLETYHITYKDVAEDGTEYEITGLTPNTYTKQDDVIYPSNITYNHHGDTRHQYAFDGWSTSADLSNVVYGFARGMTGDVTLYARWNIATPQGSVVYDCGNNHQITRTNYVGFTVLPPTATECRITLDTLIGWTCNGVEHATDEYMPVTEDTTTCVANIEMEEYNLNYELNGGTWLDGSDVRTTYTRLDSFALPTSVVKPNYDFLVWSLAPDYMNAITNIKTGTTHDTTVYAQWMPKTVRCEAGYYLPAGTLVCAQCEENKYCSGGNYEYSETTDSGIENCPASYPWSDAGSVSENDCYNNCSSRDYYVVSGRIYRNRNTCAYTPIVYHINYVLNGGEFESDTNVIYEYNVTTPFISSLVEPVQDGKIFVGWFDENNTEITGIDTSLATDITLYARWIEEPCHEDYYKTSGGVCVACPEHGYSDGGYVSACSCADGYYWNSATHECLYDYESECLSRGEDYRWDANTQQCVYEGCSVGYYKTTSTTSAFNVDISKKGNSYISRSNDGQHCYGSASDSCEGNTLNNGEWETYFDYGVIKGIASCNNTPDSETADTSYMGVETSGQYCWCQINYFTPTGGNIESRISKWGYRYNRDDDASCKNHCASNCASYLRDKTSFRQKMYDFQTGIICMPIDYTITYELYGGYAENPTSYNVETATFTLNNPEKTNYIFMGWCETENCSNPTLSYTIEQGSIGDKYLYAVWELDESTQCNENYYYDENISDCVKCPVGTLSDAGSVGQNSCVEEQFECDAGEYLYVDENVAECRTCPIGYYCPEGVWTVETADESKTQCPHGTTTEYDGASAISECHVVCPSGKYLRIGENESDKLCLYEEQQTHPALAIQVNGRTYYANMGQRNLTINAETTKKMRVEYMGRIYNVYDASME